MFAIDEHVEVEATWAVYQRIVAAYRDPDRAAGRRALQAVIDSLRRGVPEALAELRKLGRTMNRRPSATCWPTSMCPARATVPPRRSTAGWNTCAAPHWASGTSATTSLDRYWNPADSDHSYTLDCDEPHNCSGTHSNRGTIL